MKQFIYLAFWFIQIRFLRKKKPLQTVLFITNQCNLSCRHCSVYDHRQPVHKSMNQIREELLYAYKAGSRFVDFEGGDPLLWKEDGKTVNDLITMAKKIGFFSCTVTTNAQLPFSHIEADSIWVSMDGVGEVHDNIRGLGSFERLETHVAQCGRRNLSVNMVINNENYTNVVQVLEYVRESPYIQSVSFNFHTPYAGTEYLFLEWEIRNSVIDTILKMKKQGYPVLNSTSGLKLMKTNNFKKTCWISNFILVDGTRLSECAGKTVGVCSQCGYAMAAEMHCIFDFKFDTLLSGLKLRVFRVIFSARR